jgi:hypothetical protein
MDVGRVVDVSGVDVAFIFWVEACVVSVSGKLLLALDSTVILDHIFLSHGSGSRASAADLCGVGEFTCIFKRITRETLGGEDASLVIIGPDGAPAPTFPFKS